MDVSYSPDTLLPNSTWSLIMQEGDFTSTVNISGLVSLFFVFILFIYFFALFY